PVGDAVLALLEWGLLSLLVRWLSLFSQQFATFVNGSPTVLVRKGQVLEQNLRQAKLTVSELMSLLREKDAFKLADVEFSVLEPDGQISVMKKSDSQPLTPQTVNLPVQTEPAPYTVIADGNVIPQNLANAGYDRSWLWEEIRRQGARDFKDVFLAQVDGKGNLYVDLYEDSRLQAPPRNPSKALLLAELKKIQADLEGFALQTNNPSAKAEYQQAAQQMKQLIQAVEPDLRLDS
ncbi:MAG: DUF421 domain-containing protein, partial [Alicyclobacillus sp.]|nr:DUF421 domain-containing protein [Alicyclobacillus sp.]